MCGIKTAPDCEDAPGWRVALADQLRELIEATVITSAVASPEQLESATRMVAAAIAELPRPSSVRQYRAASTAGRLDRVNLFDSPEHPLAPPWRVVRCLDGEIEAEATLTVAHEGPPGRVHGGVVAGILDHAAGLVVRSLDIVAMTVSLDIELHHATPYGESLAIKARIVERDGRRLRVESALVAEDTKVVASCRALMIELADRPAWAAGSS